ncbi:hypothetical protein C7S20_15915 [Christiangramia fulva]|uniref:DUF4468 domain-containing protein n=1 Tax=Christiangramia fulva TaxID=2126553 RepID=A0A2R3Z8M2_9FLAO|nr:DUF4468 domain-containing protein [Christiangramia fulva]AVR46629.1 hypothetical protein C7S20_15915 [Christiangramia fulva]
MKTFTLSLIFSFIFLGTYAQKTAEKFTLSSAGFEDSVIREYPGKSAAELYLAAKMWAEFTLDNPETAVSRDIKNDYLEYQVFVPSAFTIKDNGNSYTWDAMFDLAFRFKDGKIRYDVEIVEISSPNAPAFAIVGGPKQWAFYSLNNKPLPLTSEARKTMEDIVNDFIRGVSSFVNRDAKVPENGKN